MVPVIRNADHLSILELAKAIDDLNARAQTKSLKLEEIHGSTFSITNYGAFGSSFGVPVINYPEAGILGVGKITKKPVVLDDEIEIRNILPLSMSFDHRIVDGADAGRFMNTIKDFLSNPQLLLLS
jgi:pyruvate dehydrogenase E2 component (dihydrolipoamide acetyltransferase)